MSLTKAEIGRAVTAVRELSEIIERIEKATWPETQNDVFERAISSTPNRAPAQTMLRNAPSTCSATWNAKSLT